MGFLKGLLKQAFKLPGQHLPSMGGNPAPAAAPEAPTPVGPPPRVRYRDTRGVRGRRDTPAGPAGLGQRMKRPAAPSRMNSLSAPAAPAPSAPAPKFAGGMLTTGATNEPRNLPWEPRGAASAPAAPASAAPAPSAPASAAPAMNFGGVPKTDVSKEMRNPPVQMLSNGGVVGRNKYSKR